MPLSSLQYIEPVFRPPSEARSLILQVTNGCSWNQCGFCDMYQSQEKRFQVKPPEQLEQEIQFLATHHPQAAGLRFFLADGDAMTLSVRRLTHILGRLRHYFPDFERASAYCLPRNLRNKSVAELRSLRELGLDMVYVGCESGDDRVLEAVRKGETFESSREALLKLKAAGIRASVMILNGLGGRLYSEQHAIHSAKLMNATQPEFLSTLVVSFPFGVERFEAGFPEGFEPLQQSELFEELYQLIDTLELQSTVFRSDHASNYLVLKGKLGADKSTMLSTIQAALQRPGSIPLRQEWQRGL